MKLILYIYCGVAAWAIYTAVIHVSLEVARLLAGGQDVDLHQSALAAAFVTAAMGLLNSLSQGVLGEQS